MLIPPQGVGLNQKKYRFNNMPYLDIINANKNPVIIDDTTAVTTTATAYTQVKSYSGIGGVKNGYGKYFVNAIRIQVYGYVSAGTGYVQIQVDGATTYTVLKAITGTATGTSFTNTASALLVDAIIELTADASHTIAILAYNATSGDSTTIADVYGFQGYAVTATTLTEIDNETIENFILDQIGMAHTGDNGIHAIAFVNRSTTTTATLQLADNFTSSGAYGVTLTASAGSDGANAGTYLFMGDNNGNESVPTGYNGAWSWSAYGQVGASGDVLLVGNLFIYYDDGDVKPPTDLLASIAIITYIPNGLSTGCNILLDYSPLNTCNGFPCNAGLALAVLSEANSGSSQDYGIEVANNMIPLTAFTADMILNHSPSGHGITGFLLIGAIET